MPDIATRRTNNDASTPRFHMRSEIVATFRTIEGAKEYVKMQTVTSIEYNMRAIWIAPEIREEFLDEFLNDDKYLVDRRYFINMTQREYTLLEEVLRNRSARYANQNI